MREYDCRTIGLVDIRHEINELLHNCNGYIEYGFHPSEWMKGYATRILALALDYCRDLNLDNVILACEKRMPPLAGSLSNAVAFLNANSCIQMLRLCRYSRFRYKTEINPGFPA